MPSAFDEAAMADDYQVLEELGSGSFGVVYKAIERSTNELVAIKHVCQSRLLHLQSLTRPD